ncbi:MAG TPA: GAF domain-containing sensor histidine kinase [Candidatus Dormibacteraeota bacterium]|jgi:signal transduction histidine kinase|nr:GAF domain-containing sensor histidine kinase [Candidatus Dormibacteraeota bacterium]
MPATRTDADVLRALLTLQRELALEVDLDRILERIAAAACELLHADRATIYVIDAERAELWSRVMSGGEMSEIRLPLGGRSLAATVARSGETILIEDAYADARFNSEVDARSGYRTQTLLVLPVDDRDGNREGVLQVVNKRAGTFGESDRELGAALASSAGIALEHVRLHGELREERLRVLRIAEETRHRLARDLHDTIAQTLANGAVSAEVAARFASRNAKATQELKRLRRKLLEAHDDLRGILFSLRPVVLETGGLAEATKALAQRLDGTGGVRVQPRRTDARTRLRPEVEAGAFQIMQEAANNAIKHGAKRVTLDAYEDDDETILRVEDDGAGFDVASLAQRYAQTGSLGLLQIRESARMIGAQLMLDSSPGRGTRVVVGIPHERDGAMKG